MTLIVKITIINNKELLSPVVAPVYILVQKKIPKENVDTEKKNKVLFYDTFWKRSGKEVNFE